jgi:hypothetical protein
LEPPARLVRTSRLRFDAPPRLTAFMGTPSLLAPTPIYRQT